MKILPITHNQLFTSKKRQDKPTLDYSELNIEKLNHHDMQIINEDIRNNKINPEVREYIITSRIPKTIEHAKEFVKAHPEYNLDELIQDLMVVMVESFDDYVPREGHNFNVHASRREDIFLRALLREQQPNVELVSLEEIKDTKDETLFQKEFDDVLRMTLASKIVNNATPMERMAILRHNTNDYRPVSLQKVADRLGVWKSTVNLHEKRIAKQLKNDEDLKEAVVLAEGPCGFQDRLIFLISREEDK